MTAIRIKCPTCGEVDLSPDELSLYVPSEDRVTYSFTCPECDRTVERPTTRKTAALLIAAGVEPVTTSAAATETVLPPEDRSPDPEAPPLTLDDLLELHLLLQDDRALAELLRR